MPAVQYESTLRIPSTLYPGVTIVIRKPTEKRLRKLRLHLAEPSEKERDIYKQYAVLTERQVIKRKEDGTEEIDPVSCTPVKEFTSPEDIQEAVKIFGQLDEFRTSEVYPIYLRWGLSKIEDMEFDGHEVRIEDLLSDESPTGFLEEVLDAIRDNSEVNPEKKTEPS